MPSKSASDRTVLTNVAEGIKWGLVMAALLCTWVAVLALVSGNLVFRSRNGESLHVLIIIALYVIGGITTGALVGGLRRLLQWRAGAVGLGMVAVIPFGAGVLAARNGFTEWGRTEGISLVIIAMVFGGAGGLIMREFVRPPPHE